MKKLFYWQPLELPVNAKNAEETKPAKETEKEKKEVIQEKHE
jgi:predicted small lipoprotein YifL